MKYTEIRIGRRGFDRHTLALKRKFTIYYLLITERSEQIEKWFLIWDENEILQ